MNRKLRYFIGMILTIISLGSFQTAHAIDNAEVYNIELMKENNIESGLGAEYDSIESLVNDLIAEYNINSDEISFAYYNFTSDQHYYINPDLQMIAASTIKVPIVALYLDLIAQGQYTFDSQIPYVEDYIGGGTTGTTSPLADLMSNAIIYSDNSAWYSLMSNYGSFSDNRQAILDFVGYYDVPGEFFADNYSSAYLAEQWLIKVAVNPDYQYVVNLMKQTDPKQLFTSYIAQGMANKYGRLDNYIHDTGIYYENNQAQYVLAIYTNNQEQADPFIEMLSLRINEWYRSHYLSAEYTPIDIKKDESGVSITKTQNENSTSTESSQE